MSESASPLGRLIEFGKQTRWVVEDKRYRTARALAAILVLAFSLILGAVIGSTVPQNSQAVSQAGQALIGVDGFLAAASGVIAFFYSGKLFEFVSPSSSLMLAAKPLILASFEATAEKEFAKSLKDVREQLDLSRPLTENEIAEGQKRIMDAIGKTLKGMYEETGKVVRDMVTPARRMAYYASFVLIVLVISAFFSTMAILGDYALYLGWGFGFTVLGSGFLALAWADAHVSLTRFLIAVQAHETLRSTPSQPGTR